MAIFNGYVSLPEGKGDSPSMSCGRHSWFVWVMTPSGCLAQRKVEVFVGFKEQKWMLLADKNWESSQQKMEMHRVLLCFDQSKIGFNQPTSDTRPGKQLHNYGKSPFFLGKLTISMAIFQFAFCMFTRPGMCQQSCGFHERPG